MWKVQRFKGSGQKGDKRGEKVFCHETVRGLEGHSVMAGGEGENVDDTEGVGKKT